MKLNFPDKNYTSLSSSSKNNTTVFIMSLTSRVGNKLVVNSQELTKEEFEQLKEMINSFNV